MPARCAATRTDSEIGICVRADPDRIPDLAGQSIGSSAQDPGLGVSRGRTTGSTRRGEGRCGSRSNRVRPYGACPAGCGGDRGARDLIHCRLGTGSVAPYVRRILVVGTAFCRCRCDPGSLRCRPNDRRFDGYSSRFHIMENPVRRHDRQAGFVVLLLLRWPAALLGRTPRRVRIGLGARLRRWTLGRPHRRQLVLVVQGR